MISIETRENITIFHLSGEVAIRDILDQALGHIAENTALMTIWDFSEVSRIDVSSAEIKAAVDELKTASVGKSPRTVAFVEFGKVNMGMVKIFIAFCQIAGLKNHYRVFRRIEYAFSWLESQCV